MPPTIIKGEIGSGEQHYVESLEPVVSRSGRTARHRSDRGRHRSDEDDLEAGHVYHETPETKIRRTSQQLREHRRVWGYKGRKYIREGLGCLFKLPRKRTPEQGAAILTMVFATICSIWLAASWIVHGYQGCWHDIPWLNIEGRLESCPGSTVSLLLSTFSFGFWALLAQSYLTNCIREHRSRDHHLKYAQGTVYNKPTGEYTEEILNDLHRREEAQANAEELVRNGDLPPIYEDGIGGHRSGRKHSSHSRGIDGNNDPYGGSSRGGPGYGGGSRPDGSGRRPDIGRRAGFDSPNGRMGRSKSRNMRGNGRSGQGERAIGPRGRGPGQRGREDF